MRKGKKILALASIFAGVALVGTTFAAWAVTDNAPQLGWKISGDKVDTDVNTHFVTLEYGQSTSYQSVGNLESGTKRLAATLKLKATFAGETNYYGKLDLAMAQEKEGTKLLDYIKIYAVDKAPVAAEKGVAFAADTTTYITLDGSGESPTLSGSREFQMTSGSEETVYIVVEFISEGVDAQVLNAVAKDLVDVTADWNHSTDHNQGVAVSGAPIYLRYTGNGLEDEKVYCYAWGGKAENAPYPGVEMVDEGNGLYSYQLDMSKYTKVIFNNNNTTEGKAFKTAEVGMEVTESIATNTPCWDTTLDTDAWVAKPVADPDLTALYYVVGDFPAGTDDDWKCLAANAMTFHENGNDDYYESAAISFTAGQKFKVRNNSNEAVARWYSNASTWDECGFTIDEEMNLVVSATGSRTVRYYPSGNNGNYVVFGS